MDATVEPILNASEFVKLQDEWNELLSMSKSDNIFLTWEWVYTWWQIFREGKELFTITIRDEEKKLIGVAPLYIKTINHLNIFKIREIRFLGYGEDVCPDYLDFILYPGREKELIQVLFQFLSENQKRWDIMNLTDIAETSTNIDHTKYYAEIGGYVFKKVKSYSCPYLILPRTWDEYVSTLGKNMKYNIKRRTKNLHRDYDVNFFIWDNIDTITQGIDRLAQLHQKRWEKVGISHSFSSPKYNEFHKEIAKCFQKNGRLRLYCLALNKEIVAILYAFKYKNRIYYYQSGFDPDWYKWSVGLVLKSCIIKNAIEEGIEEFDFLRGDHEYKYEWTKSDRTTANILIISNESLGSKFYALNKYYKPKIKTVAKNYIPTRLIEFYRRMKAYDSH